MMRLQLWRPMASEVFRKNAKSNIENIVKVIVWFE